MTFISFREQHKKLFEEQERTIQKEYDLMQDKIENMNQQFTDNLAELSKQTTSAFADLFQSSLDGRANIQSSVKKVNIFVLLFVRISEQADSIKI